MIEILGLTATIFVLISFVMKKQIKIRCFNIVGATLFVIYGILINSLSTWLLNAILVIIHIYYIKRGIANE